MCINFHHVKSIVSFWNLSEEILCRNPIGHCFSQRKQRPDWSTRQLTQLGLSFWLIRLNFVTLTLLSRVRLISVSICVYVTIHSSRLWFQMSCQVTRRPVSRRRALTSSARSAPTNTPSEAHWRTTWRRWDLPQCACLLAALAAWVMMTHAPDCIFFSLCCRHWSQASSLVVARFTASRKKDSAGCLNRSPKPTA